MDGESFLDTLHVLRRELGIAGGSLRADWAEFGNVSSVKDLVQLLARTAGPVNNGGLN